ncbi:TonB-dependent receptor [Mangrovimicrobium sediminis]|uniref:TonB-dependent receptor n=1 Tax=Mangrovimicrobium sediminis TaxID=2562682 RepID=A0A4Z0M4S3_9GAMM|nr:TonB-dependent receptor [Haliea sp. SAOS-164]TGD74693.1 TonB-dependent receptor [Haliea sp. SAOS-164]
MHFKPAYPLLAACACLALPATAQTSLEEMVVTSSRIPTPLRQVGTSVSVITAEEIQSLGFFSLQDVLRTQPGVAVSNNGGAGKLSTLRIRGEEGYRTRVFLDGIDISDTSSPQYSPRMEQLLSAGVQRVEILRGPQGMMYGADAGGVINITTHAPRDGFSGDASAEGGRYGTAQLAGNLAYGSEQFEGNLSAADFSADGFNASSNDQVEQDEDSYDNTSLHGRVAWRPTDALTLSLAGHDVDGESEYDGCYDALDFSSTNDCRDEYSQRAWRAGAQWRGERLSHELAYNDSRTERTNFSNGIEAFANEGSLERWSYLGSFRASDALQLVYGADLQTEHLEDGSDGESRDQDGYYLEYQGSWTDRLYVTVGARYDDNDDFGSYTSWRASAAYLVPTGSGDVKLRGTYGTGFRAPSLYEIAYNAGPYAYPPAAGTELDAEESAGYDLAVSWFGNDGLYLEAVYFDQRVEDELYFDLFAYSGYLQGDGEARSRGVELIAEWPVLASLSLTGNYTWNDTEAADGNPRVYRPEHLANLGLTWRGLGDRLRIGVDARLARDAVGLDGRPMDDYTVVDARASFALLQGLDIYVRAENLLDEDYEEVPTYNTSGAAAYAGVRYTF